MNYDTQKISFEYYTYKNIFIFNFTEMPEILRDNKFITENFKNMECILESYSRPDFCVNEPSSNGNKVDFIFLIGKEKEHDGSACQVIFKDIEELELKVNKFIKTINQCNEVLEKYFENSSNTVQLTK